MKDEDFADIPRSQVSRRRLVKYVGVGAILATASPLAGSGSAIADDNGDGDGDGHFGRQGGGDSGGRVWRAGDHHVHSEYSGGWDTSTNPPRFIKGGEAVYPIVTNAIMAKNFGLTWAMCTDHGGPTHSKVNLEQAYPDLLRSRKLVPEVLQFWGMEFDAPALDHHTLMIPRHDDEARLLFELESRFASREGWPADPTRDTEAKMVEFLRYARGLEQRPLVIAHHTSRSAPGLGVYGQDTPREFRNGNNAAPEIYVGFEGAPGRQAGPLTGGVRGGYVSHPTHGGFDQMTARVGGLWDSLLGEGRRWWITAGSDSHVHWTRGGSDFWPGEYSKTYVHARQDYADIMDGLRNGRIFVTTGDLVTSLDLTASGQGRAAAVGETITLNRRNRTDVEIEITFRPLAGKNANGDRPQVRRVDLIIGRITGPNSNLDADTNPTTTVVARFGPRDWRRQGRDYVIRHTLGNVESDIYARVRGTSTDEAEPLADGPESPWSDLWFYSNPVFVHVR
ncbi:phosphoesterase [Micromonospora sp. NPDC050397]|uniref:phosphoesterase n=1 Tax=Micromonospora sp. NPDC050397 TaxID=3364279 RepID=UPI00384BE9AC